MNDSSVLDTKCPPAVGCWFCKNACINCMKPSTPGLASITDDGLNLQFCSQECSESFTGPDMPLQVSAELVNLPSSVEASECHDGESHRLIYSIFAFARGGGKGTKFSLKIYQTELATEHTQYCAHYNVRQLFSQQFCKFLVSSDAAPLKWLDYSNPQAFTSSSSYWTVEQHLLEAMRVLFKCHEEFMKMYPSLESMTIYLDCSEQLISKLMTAQHVQHLIPPIASYRVVSKVSEEWSVKPIASLLLSIDNLKPLSGNVSHESLEDVLDMMMLLQIDLIQGISC